MNYFSRGLIFLGLFILVGTLGASSVGAVSLSDFQVCNLSNSGGDVYWLGDTESSSEVRYGTTETFGSSVAGNVGRIHHAALTGLPQDTYYIQGVSDNQVVGGDPVDLPNPSFGTFHTIFGIVEDTNGVPVTEALVTFRMNNSSLFCMETTDQGYWFFDTTNLKDLTTLGAYQVSNGDVFDVSVVTPWGERKFLEGNLQLGGSTIQQVATVTVAPEISVDVVPDPVTPPSSVTPGVVSVGLPMLSVGAGQTFMAPITVSDVTNENVTAAEFVLTFDPQLVQPIGVSTPGTLTAGWLAADASASGQMAIAMASARPASGAGTFVNVEFRALDYSGTSALGFSREKFNRGTPSISTTLGSVTIVGGSSLPDDDDDQGEDEGDQGEDDDAQGNDDDQVVATSTSSASSTTVSTASTTTDTISNLPSEIPPVFSFVYPIAGDQLVAGNKHTIQWNSSLGQHIIEDVRMSLYKNGTLVLNPTFIAYDTSNNGSYAWTVPGTHSGSGYTLLIWNKYYPNNGTESAAFTIASSSPSTSSGTASSNTSTNTTTATQASTSATSTASSTPTTTTTDTTTDTSGGLCTDSDGGADEFVKGTTVRGTGSYTDWCYGLTNPYFKNSLWEYVCSPDTDSPRGQLVTCANGCSNGVCLPGPSASAPNSDSFFASIAAGLDAAYKKAQEIASQLQSLAE